MIIMSPYAPRILSEAEPKYQKNSLHYGKRRHFRPTCSAASCIPIMPLSIATLYALLSTIAKIVSSRLACCSFRYNATLCIPHDGAGQLHLNFLDSLIQRISQSLACIIIHRRGNTIRASSHFILFYSSIAFSLHISLVSRCIVHQFYLDTPQQLHYPYNCYTCTTYMYCDTTQHRTMNGTKVIIFFVIHTRLSFFRFGRLICIHTTFSPSSSIETRQFPFLRSTLSSNLNVTHIV